MQQIVALTSVAVVVRHWFEIDLEDSSMEHGARVELRELASQPRRGSESAAQLLTLDRPLWRADLFDRLTDEPGTFGVAHFHPHFVGNEPCPRVWDSKLTASPWRWLEEQFAHLGGAGNGEPWQLASPDAHALRGLAFTVAAFARQYGPDKCTSAGQCFDLTQDARDSVRLMISSLRRPDLLDTQWVAPWTAA